MMQVRANEHITSPHMALSALLRVTRLLREDGLPVPEVVETGQTTIAWDILGVQALNPR